MNRNQNKTDSELEQFILQLLKDTSLKPVEKVKKLVTWEKAHDRPVYSVLEHLPANMSSDIMEGFLRLELAEARGHWEDVTNETL